MCNRCGPWDDSDEEDDEDTDGVPVEFDELLEGN
jgi:hypothetical protein